MLKRIGKFCVILIIIILISYTAYLKSNENPLKDILTDPLKDFLIKRNNTIENELYSTNAILIDLNKNTILMEKKSEEIIYPASLTKIMTVLVAIENIPDLQKRILLSESIFTDLYAANASMAGFLPNEEVVAIDLLYGAMLPSGAEASIALSDYITGSETKFVKLMNEKAKQLGMENTHFTNATGLHHPDHYTTVKDISILLQYALKNTTFRDIFTAERYSTKPTNLHPEGITLTSRMFKNIEYEELIEGEIVGGKTGYTEQAGLCLASLAVINGQEYILITVGADGSPRSEQYNITDAVTVYSQL